MTDKSIFKKYSKDVLIEFMFSNTAIMLKKKNEVMRELEFIKKNIDFDRMGKEIAVLQEKRKNLTPESFKDFDSYLLTKIPLDKKIHALIDRQSKLVMEM